MSVVADVSQPAVEVSVSPSPPATFYRLSVEQYHQMVREGILQDGAPVELLQGMLVEKMTISPRHRRSSRRVRIALERVVPQGWYVEVTSPITLAGSEPEPDAAIVCGSDDDYPDRHPGRNDVALVVEVAESSLSYDQGWKKSLYAESAIPVYWIVNLVDRRVEVYSDPTGPAESADYRTRQDLGETEQVPVMIESREVARISVRELLP